MRKNLKNEPMDINDIFSLAMTIGDRTEILKEELHNVLERKNFGLNGNHEGGVRSILEEIDKNVESVEKNSTKLLSYLKANKFEITQQ